MRWNEVLESNDCITRLKCALGGFDYQLVVGGAIRDSIMENPYSDIDLVFTDKSKYINTVGELCARGYTIDKLCKRNWYEGYDCLFGKYESPAGTIIDVMFFNCSEEEVFDLFKRTFDFNVNLCYMKEDKIFATEHCMRDIEINTLEMVTNKMSIGNCIVRALKFQEKGFKIGGSVVSYAIERIEIMERSPREVRHSRYIKVCNGYWTEYEIHEKKLYGDFFKLLSDETVILAMMSNSDKILNCSKVKHNKKVNNKSMLGKLKDLFV